jgi:hypothetical protein
MTTTVRPGGLRGWPNWCLVIAMAIAFSAPAFAGTESSASQSSKVQPVQRTVRKLCYVRSGWGVPQPCDRFTGPVPTTAGPMDIIGRAPQPQ